MSELVQATGDKERERERKIQSDQPPPSPPFQPDPILEAAHLRKHFPLRSLNLLGAKQAVHAVEDASFAL